MYESVSGAIQGWVNGNTESVINWLWEQKPNVVALFFRQFVYDNEFYGDNSLELEGQVNIICNRLADRYQSSRTDLTSEEKRRILGK